MRLILSLVVCLCSTILPAIAGDAKFPVGSRFHGPWNLTELNQVPSASWGEVGDAGIREVYYAGEPYSGKPTRIFAYFGIPQSPGPHPGMVLVHGGGGKAFRDWVKHWVSRGYAALAMDLGGHGPVGRLADGGPDQSDRTKFREITPATLKDVWSYHAVAAVIRGHSLLASQPNVDPHRIGITGISWGGYLTCIVTGIDSRLKVAVPVYGCGYLGDNSYWVQPQFNKMSQEQRSAWLESFDPSRYLPGVGCPILFLNGTNDFAYPMDSYRKSYELVKSPRTISLIPRLPHGHIWTFPEVDAFVDHQLKGTAPLLTLGKLSIAEGKASVSVTGGGEPQAATLHYTTDQGDWPKRLWKESPAEIGGEQISANVPAARPLVCYLGVKDRRGLFVSTAHVVLEK